jgi:hypothetical protein
VLQILLANNPLARPGLTLVQSLLFWEAAVHHFLAIPTVLLGLLPVLYMFTEVSLHAVDLCVWCGNFYATG